MATIKLIVVDLSHYATVTDLNAAKSAGLAGIIYKATQGSSYKDPTYASRRSEAAAAGLLWGAYHFGDNSSVQSQVSNFLATAQPDANTLLALDYEPNGDATMSLDQATQFLTLVAQQIGRQPVLYSGSLIKQTLTQPNSFFGSHGSGSRNTLRSRCCRRAGRAIGCGNTATGRRARSRIRCPAFPGIRPARSIATRSMARPSNSRRSGRGNRTRLSRAQRSVSKANGALQTRDPGF